MSNAGILILLYVVGVVLLVGEIFIPSHALLTISGFGFLVWAVVKTFLECGYVAGVAATFGCMVFLPTFAIVAVKIWPRTYVGRRIAPPNPTVTSADTTIPVEELKALIGRSGRSLSPLRPVGICEFNGRRVSCVAEFGMLNAGEPVIAVRVQDGNLRVAGNQT